MVIRATELAGRSGHEAGRQLLAETYRELTGEAMPPIRVTDRGKPYFVGADLNFSISHTDGHAFCALSEKPVGIDAEETDREINQALAEKILSPAEKQRWQAAPDHRAALLRLWVLKEAFAKATGRGWGSYLSQTDFDPADERIQRISGCYVAVIELEETERNICCSTPMLI